jgi:hypothetical protein
VGLRPPLAKFDAAAASRQDERTCNFGCGQQALFVGVEGRSARSRFSGLRGGKERGPLIVSIGADALAYIGQRKIYIARRPPVPLSS